MPTRAPLRYPDHLAARYRAQILRRQAQVWGLVNAQVGAVLHVRGADINARADSAEEDLAAILRVIAVVERVVGEEMPPDRGALRGMGEQLDLFARRQVDDRVKRLARVSILPGSPSRDYLLDQWVDRNVSLITSIDQQFFGQLREKARTAVLSGRSTRDLREELQSRYGVSKSRADLIARDQVGKLNGQITQQRHADLGIEEYIWRTSRDERVRGNPAGLYPDARHSHYALEGRRFKVRGPGAPGIGHPGDDFQCRCTQEPVLPWDTEESLQAYDRQAAAAERQRASLSLIGGRLGA